MKIHHRLYIRVIWDRVSMPRLVAGLTRRRFVDAITARVIVMAHSNMPRPGSGTSLTTQTSFCLLADGRRRRLRLAAARLATSAAEQTLAAESPVTEGGRGVTLHRADHRANCRYVDNGSPTLVTQQCSAVFLQCCGDTVALQTCPCSFLFFFATPNIFFSGAQERFELRCESDTAPENTGEQGGLHSAL